jgi:hypothetical protein
VTKIGSGVPALSRDEGLEIATAAGAGARRRYRLTWLDTDRPDQAAVMAPDVPGQDHRTED